MAEKLDAVDRLSDWTLLNIFSYLNAPNIVSVSAVCQRWLRVARDEQLWKRRFRLDFRSQKADLPKTAGWLSEYRRFADECPRVAVRKLTDHKEHVLHVSFSRDGSMLASCSRDGTLKVWRASGDWPLLHDKDLRQLLYWRHTLCARFNQSDRSLLVSGLRAGETAASAQNAIVGAGANSAVGLGELAVFDFVKKSKTSEDPFPGQPSDEKPKCQNSDEDLVFRCRAINEPFDVYGCWYDNESILNGQSRRFNQTSTMSDTYFLHAASEQTTSTRLFQFYNPTGGVLRNLLVSSYVRKPSSDDDQPRGSSGKDKLLIFTTGRRVDTPHEIGVKLVRNERVSGPLEAAAKTLKMRSEKRTPHASSFRKIQSIKKIELEPAAQEETATEKPATETKPAPELGQATKTEAESAKASTSTEAEEKEETEKEEVKAAEAEEEPPPSQQAPPANAVKEKEESEEEEESDDEEPLQQVHIRVHTFDRVDHIIETYGRIVGVTLSPDQRYVFVHTRPFIDVSLVYELPLDQPVPVHDHTEICIIDLQTCTLLDDSFVGRQADRVRDENSNSASPTFFVDLDASDEYVLSGSEESNAYLWDRRHRCLIRSLPHEQGRLVHSVAFNPRDSNVCVSASDDGAVTVWYSKATARLEKDNRACVYEA